MARIMSEKPHSIRLFKEQEKTIKKPSKELPWNQQVIHITQNVLFPGNYCRPLLRNIVSCLETCH